MAKGFDGEIVIYSASAGSGKSYALRQILYQYATSPQKTLRTAFVGFSREATNSTALQMKMDTGYPASVYRYYRTIHALCFHELRLHLTDVCSERAMADFRAQYHYEDTRVTNVLAEGYCTDSPRRVYRNLYHLHQNNEQVFQQIFGQGGFDANDYRAYVQDYRYFKRRNKLLDFDDILVEGLAIQPPDIDCLCIDEAQDLTPLQWRVLFSIFRKAKHIFIAGDAGQSIYQFFGTSPEVLLSLRGEQRFLDKSYRCPSNIVNFAQRFRDGNTLLPHMTCSSVKEGGRVNYIEGLDDLLEDWDDGKTYMMIAHDNYMLHLYVDWCRLHLIPYRLKGEWMFSQKEMLEYKLGKTEKWKPAHKELADAYNAKGLLFNTTAMKVSIDTIHGVKGLEADRVVVRGELSKRVRLSVARGIATNMEYCLFYVAATRARQTLYILKQMGGYFFGPLYISSRFDD